MLCDISIPLKGRGNSTRQLLDQHYYMERNAEPQKKQHMKKINMVDCGCRDGCVVKVGKIRLVMDISVS